MPQSGNETVTCGYGRAPCPTIIRQTGYSSPAGRPHGRNSTALSRHQETRRQVTMAPCNTLPNLYSASQNAASPEIRLRSSPLPRPEWYHRRGPGPSRTRPRPVTCAGQHTPAPSRFPHRPQPVSRAGPGHLPAQPAHLRARRRPPSGPVHATCRSRLGPDTPTRATTHSASASPRADQRILSLPGLRRDS